MWKLCNIPTATECVCCKDIEKINLWWKTMSLLTTALHFTLGFTPHVYRCVRASNCKVPVQTAIQWNHSRLSRVTILIYVHLFLLKFVQLILQINIGLKNIKWYYTFGHSRMYRYTAYWQLARWAWGYLGEKIRVVLPSYDVTQIRKTFPNVSGNYICFITKSSFLKYN